jgi:hypothetical protein
VISVLQKGHEDKNLHVIAADLLNNGKVEEAWKVLLSEL